MENRLLRGPLRAVASAAAVLTLLYALPWHVPFLASWRHGAPGHSALAQGCLPSLRQGRHAEMSSVWLRAEGTWRQEMQDLWGEWLEGLEVKAPSLPTLDSMLLWRAQRLGLPYPVHQRLIAPFLEGGSKAGQFEEMYPMWRAAGLFERMKFGAQASALVDLKQGDDYDKVLGLWMQKLQKSLDWPKEALESQLNFAIGVYTAQTFEPKLFEALGSFVPADETLRQEAVALWGSVANMVAENRERFSLERLKEFDSLFIGHSNFHVENPFQPWEDTSLAIRSAYPKRCKRPLYNDIGKFHLEDLTDDLLEMDEATLEKTIPLGHYGLVAATHVSISEGDIERLGKLLKPGGVLVWNTWWRKKGEYAGDVPDVKKLGFEKLVDDVLPLGFTSFPFSKSGFQYRLCSARKSGGKSKAKKGFR